MNKDQKRLLRQAVRMLSQWSQAQLPVTTSFQLPSAVWEECQGALRRMELARANGWLLAWEQLKDELQSSLQWLRTGLNPLDALLQTTPQSPQVSLRELHADLLALEKEFTEVVIDRRQRSLTVTTEPIELEDEYLGPFEIQLSWAVSRAADRFSYRVIACEPHPAASNSSLTHPHVQDDTLCEGDGHDAVRLALEQGRIYDFFMIVTNILRTYNPASPFLSLANWHGRGCSDCGNSMPDDDSWGCDKCGSTLCGDCYYCCGGCDVILCHQCIGRCSKCQEHHCSHCLQDCTDCDQTFCQNCLHDQERCSDCHAKQNEETEEEPDSQEILVASTPLQPDRLGEADLPA